VFTTLNGLPVLLHNNLGQKNDWIGFELQGTSSNRDAIGARITVQLRDHRIVRWITGGSSYLSSHDKRVLVGLGHIPAGTSVNAEIRWPNGNVQNLLKLQPGRYHHILEQSASSSTFSR
jgi:enediyne biosynthesis protein E4